MRPIDWGLFWGRLGLGLSAVAAAAAAFVAAGFRSRCRCTKVVSSFAASRRLRSSARLQGESNNTGRR